MTRYYWRLPAELGGGVYQGEINGTSTVVSLTIPGVGDIEVPGTCVTQVMPPLPPEPPNGFVGRAGTQIWERDDNPEMNGGTDPHEHWWRVGDDAPYSWAAAQEVMARAEVVELARLVPDPADNAPALPWERADAEGDTVQIETNSVGTVKVAIRYARGGSRYVLLKPELAEEAGRALLRAAREVEQP